MEYLTALNITMFVAIIGLYFFARPFFAYRQMLADALLFTADRMIETRVKNRDSHFENLERARIEFVHMDAFWIPLFYVSVAFVALLWIGFSVKMDGGVFIVIVAGATSAVVTRGCLKDHSPKWLKAWLVEMMLIIQTEEAKKVNKRLEEIDNRVEELVNKARDGEILSPEEDLELYRLLAEAAQLANHTVLIQQSVAYNKELQSKASGSSEE